MDIVKEVLSGSKRALARAITAVENEYEEAVAIMKELYFHTGKAHIIGITGPPGAGKSTLVNQLAKTYRTQGKKVGIIAVDPTSPFSGGAILGDRLRMNELTLDQDVFIRSMSTRGSLGGLSFKTGEAVKILDAFGKDIIIVETVGVGQSEVDIMKVADTTLVVLVPGLGDDIQAIKAGILEIGDLFAINKADRDGANRLKIEIQNMLELSETKNDWRPPILETVASQGKGIDQLVESLNNHFDYLKDTGALVQRRAERTKSEIIGLLEEQISRHVLQKLTVGGRFETLIQTAQRRESDIYTIVDEAINECLK